MRLIAYLIDSAIVMALGSVLALLAYLPLVVGSVLNGLGWSGVWRVPFYVGIGQVVYFTFMEYMYGASIGKQVFNLRVETATGRKPSLPSVIIRNLSKIHSALLLTDVLVGVFSDGDTRDKFSDRLSGTVVARSGRGVKVPSLLSSQWIQEARFEDEGTDPLEAMGFGVFLVVVATIALNYPGLFRSLLGWVMGFGDGVFRLPVVLLPPLYWFLMAMGTWEVISGVIRYYGRIRPWKVWDDAASAGFNFVAANVIRTYGGDAFTWRVMGMLFVVFIGVQIVIAVFAPRLRR